MQETIKRAHSWGTQEEGEKANNIEVLRDSRKQPSCPLLVLPSAAAGGAQHSWSHHRDEPGQARFSSSSTQSCRCSMRGSSSGCSTCGSCRGCSRRCSRGCSRRCSRAGSSCRCGGWSSRSCSSGSSTRSSRTCWGWRWEVDLQTARDEGGCSACREQAVAWGCEDGGFAEVLRKSLSLGLCFWHSFLSRPFLYALIRFNPETVSIL